MIHLQDITIGQFAHRDSLIHYLDPRTKIICTFFIMFALVIVKRLDVLLLYFFLISGIFILAKLPLSLMLRNIKPFILLFLLTFLLHALFSKSGEMVKIPVLQITISTEGIHNGIFYTLRIIVLIVLANLLTLTTSPMDLTDAIESFLSPLRHLRIPAQEIAMMISIALRFIPILLEEADRIHKAQISRGVDIKGNLIKKLKTVIPLVIPLFLSTFRRANELSFAMDARCYQGGSQRSHFNVLKLKHRDWIAYSVTAVLLIPSIVLV